MRPAGTGVYTTPKLLAIWVSVVALMTLIKIGLKITGTTSEEAIPMVKKVKNIMEVIVDTILTFGVSVTSGVVFA